MVPIGPEAESLGLTHGEVHVWRATLRPSYEQISSLSVDERRRANAYRFDHDRDRFIASRSLLRQILARYVGGKPSQLRFRYGPHGKPALIGARSLRFNASHSVDMALIAVAWGVELGVDLESASVLVDPESVVRRSMSRVEIRRLDRIPHWERNQAILATWVRKEAVAKASGEGLGLALDSIQTRPGVPAQGDPVVIRTRSRTRWFLWDVPIGAGRAGALATSRGDLSVHFLTEGDATADPGEPSPLLSREASASLAR